MDDQNMDHKPTPSSRVQVGQANFVKQVYHDTDEVPGESEASSVHADTLRHSYPRGILREGSVIWVVVNDHWHQLTIFYAM